MPAFSKPTRAAEMARPVLALLLLGQWFLLLAFASSEKLHHSICDRAKQPAHDCAFASIAKSQLVSPVETVQIPSPRLIAIAGSFPSELSVLSSEDFRLTPNRGPPSEILST